MSKHDKKAKSPQRGSFFLEEISSKESAHTVKSFHDNFELRQLLNSPYKRGLKDAAGNREIRRIFETKGSNY